MSVRSMTGFGRIEFELEEAPGERFAVEIRSVNHRYLDVGVRLPRGMTRFEPEARAAVREACGRGKVDVSVTMAGGSVLPSELAIDWATAEAYLEAGKRLSSEYGVRGTLHVGQILQLQGVARTVERELDPGALGRAIENAIEKAVAALNEMRTAEGAVLERELRGRLDRIGALVEAIEGEAEGVTQAARERLRKRAEQLRDETGLLDDARLHQEIVIAADRLDITEELVRLRSHVDQFRSLLADNEPVTGAPVGRQLDFLLQEMGRESNTMGSKGNSASLAHHVVELKSELERMREQVQNVE